MSGHKSHSLAMTDRKRKIDAEWKEQHKHKKYNRTEVFLKLIKSK